MSDIQKFRKSINGFNCHDVVTYIEYLNNTHRSQVNQLNNQLQTALAQPKADTKALEEQIAALQGQCAAYEAQIQQLQAQLAAMPNAQEAPTSCTDQELEAYRRAERAERLALERARQMKAQATGVIADTSNQVQVAAKQLEDAAKTIAVQLDVYKTTVLGAGSILSDAAATLGTIAPEEE